MLICDSKTRQVLLGAASLGPQGAARVPMARITPETKGTVLTGIGMLRHGNGVPRRGSVTQGSQWLTKEKWNK